MQKTLQDLHISHERNESENIPILVEERGDAFRGIPKLRRLSLLEYLLGGIPKLELLPLFLLLTSKPSQSSNTSSTQNFNRKLGKIRQYNKANHHSKYCCKPIHILFLHFIYYNITFPWLNPLIEIDISSKQANNASKTESVLNRTVCSNMEVQYTSVTPKIMN